MFRVGDPTSKIFGFRQSYGMVELAKRMLLTLNPNQVCSWIPVSKLDSYFKIVCNFAISSLCSTISKLCKLANFMQHVYGITFT